MVYTSKNLINLPSLALYAPQWQTVGEGMGGIRIVRAGADF